MHHEGRPQLPYPGRRRASRSMVVASKKHHDSIGSGVLSRSARPEQDDSAVDVFVSYGAEDRETAGALAGHLEARGWTVWWDRRIPAGRTFSRLIEERLTAARCVVVLWSSASTRSHWVRAEAEEGARRHVLVPVLLEDADIPLPFRHIQAADLAGWDGSPSHRAFQRLASDIGAVLDRQKEPISQSRTEVPPATDSKDGATPGGGVDFHGPGSRVAHYKISSRLGVGGMGVVFRARDLNLGREVALKRPFERVDGDSETQDRFRLEACATAVLQHPHIVTVFESFEYDRFSWLAMELVDGKSLSEYLEEHGPLSPREVLRHAEGLADALRVAHQHHIVHRDIKPSNVLVDRDGLARLTDFGLARIEESPEGNGQDFLPVQPLTKTGQLMGTLAYMSPEQVLGRRLDGRSDIFSLGCVLYELCTGEPAFGGSASKGEVLNAVLNAQPTPITELNPEFPAGLERIVGKCLAKDEEARYQSAVDLLEDLRAERRLADSSAGLVPVASRVSDAPIRKLRYLLLATAAILVLSVAAIVVPS